MAPKSRAGDLHSSRDTEITNFADHFGDARPTSTDPVHEHEALAPAAPSSLPPHYDAPTLLMSPNNSANPWQYLPASGPSSPTFQRDYYTLVTNHSQAVSMAEYPWNMAVPELEHQRAHSGHGEGHVGGASLFLAPSPQGDLIQRRRQGLTPGVSTTSQPHAMLCEELAPPWYRRQADREEFREDFREDFRDDFRGKFRGDFGEDIRGDFRGDFSQGMYLRNGEFDPDVTNQEGGRMGWGRGMTSRFAESSQEGHPELATMMESSTLAPSLQVQGSDEAGASAVRSTANESACTPNSSLSLSGSGGDDSEDEECTAPNAACAPSGESSGKRKTPEGEDRENVDSTRMSSEMADLKTKNTPVRRKKKNLKRLREPRYAIKTRTDVDIMDDGFKWRKYGQKAVKYSPHPRNYYRCTTPQCPVRKRVERSSEDASLVITTYEGIHTHLTPGLSLHHRPPHTTNAHGYSGPHRPLGLGGLNPNPLAPRLPLPPEFGPLAALHQMRLLQHTLHGLAQQHQIARPGSLQWAQHFLGLQDPPVKLEPLSQYFQPQEHDFMATSGPHLHHRLPYPSRHPFQRPRGGALARSATTPVMVPDGEYPGLGQEIRSSSSGNHRDLVRRVLAAEDLQGGADDVGVEDGGVNVEPSLRNDFVSQIQSDLRKRVELGRGRGVQREPVQRLVRQRRLQCATDNHNLG